MEQSTVDRNLAQQAAWYGESVGDTVRRLLPALGLTQAQLAGVVGVSPPMLSQLASGQRAKIANPAVLARLQALCALAEDPASAQLSRAELARRTAAVGDLEPTGVLSTTQVAVPAAAAAAAVQSLLRAVAPEQELQRAVGLLAQECPQLADVLRVYGLGPSAGATSHYTRAINGNGPLE